MGKVKALIFIGISIATAFGAYEIFKNEEAPVIPDKYWGKKSSKDQKEDTSIRPFTINITDKVLNDLKDRLKLELNTGNRMVAPLEDQGFQYGFNTNYLKTVGKHWLEKYDWRQREKRINKYSHFKTKISGLDIHFMHVKSTNNKNYKKTRPLLLLHGWPGSFVEFLEIIPMLTDPKGTDINFEVVVPSLPGYGFSEGSSRPGCGFLQHAQIFLKLMQRLGHDKFYTHGGDWGTIITSAMAALYPNNVMGAHFTMCSNGHLKVHLRRIVASFYPQMFMSQEESEEYFPFSKYFALMMRETGYAHIQCTKPDTIGVGLSNSPTGLGAYILEKFSTWTNLDGTTKKDGGLGSYFKLDDLLDNVMIYWVTNSITTSVRLYSEAFVDGKIPLDRVPVNVPVGCLAPKHEFYDMPEFFLHDKFTQLVQYSRGDNGGHFYTFEEPDSAAKDIIALFTHIENSGLSKF